MSAQILQWRPRVRVVAAPPSPDPKLMWTMQKQQWRIECTLQGSDPEGWSIRVLLNGQWFFHCRFTSWTEAVRAADEKHAELANAGWAAL